MPSETSIEDVVETHRQHLKAKRLHVTTGPSATPERIAETFARINATATYWGGLQRAGARAGQGGTSQGRPAARGLPVRKAAHLRSEGPRGPAERHLRRS